MDLHHGMFSYFTAQPLFYNQNKKIKFFWENSGFLRMYLLVGYLLFHNLRHPESTQFTHKVWPAGSASILKGIWGYYSGEVIFYKYRVSYQ